MRGKVRTGELEGGDVYNSAFRSTIPFCGVMLYKVYMKAFAAFVILTILTQASAGEPRILFRICILTLKQRQY
jgi:hypothetical protein